MKNALPGDYLHLHFLVLIWGFTAILGLLITIPPVEVVFFRTLLAAAGLGALMLFQRRSFRLPRRGLLMILVAGFVIGAHWILFFASARISTASISLAGLATTSFWTSLLEPLFMKRKIRWYEISLGLVVVGGLYIVFHFELDHTAGLIMAVSAAVLSALFSVMNAKLATVYHHHVITFYEMLGACMGTLLFLPVYLEFLADGPLQLTPTSSDWIYLLILAFICTVYPYSAAVKLMKRITAFAVNLTVNLEPVYGIILAVIFFGDQEKMNAEFYIGAGVILLATLSYPAISRRYGQKPLSVDSFR